MSAIPNISPMPAAPEQEAIVLTPKETVAELDKYIIGQKDAKKAVALALRNRWRRQQLDASLREEVLPKNILMIGPTGVGKTEISRRLAKLTNAPFIKVEATKFTEVGYVGRDVEQIIRDLVEASIMMVKEQKTKEVEKTAQENTEERLITALVGEEASEDTRNKFRTLLNKGSLEDRIIELEVRDTGRGGMPTIDIPGMPGAQMGMINISDMIGKSMKSTSKKSLKISEARNILLEEESEKLVDQDAIIEQAINVVENDGIVFLDEIDKICVREGRGGEVSREGVQRDLLPLIEGTTVSTRHGSVKTDHILFIASGAFHVAKPSDLLPELQGRLPIRVELRSLDREDFRRILTEPKASLIKQYIALMKTENVDLTFDDKAIDRLADLATDINSSVENIGARRLHTVMERLLEDISFEASDRQGEKIEITADYVNEKVQELAKNADLSRFVL